MQPNMRATRLGACMKRTSAVLTWASLILIIATAPAAWCAEKSLEKVRIAVSSKSLGFLDVWAARERGFYRKHGIEAEIIAMRPPLTIGAIQAGEIDYAPPGVEHWHGAAPNEPLVQLGVVPFGGGIKFLEPVTDAQYNGQSR